MSIPPDLQWILLENFGFPMWHMMICQTIFYTLALPLPIFETNTNWETEFIYMSFRVHPGIYSESSFRIREPKKVLDFFRFYIYNNFPFLKIWKQPLFLFYICKRVQCFCPLIVADFWGLSSNRFQNFDSILALDAQAWNFTTLLQNLIFSTQSSYILRRPEKFEKSST